VVVAYYQICADIETTYSVQLPEYFTAFMNIFSLLRTDWWYSLFLPQGCLGSFTDRLFLTTLSPVGLLGLVLAFLMFHEWYSRAVHRVIDGSTACDRVRSAFSNGLLATIPVALLATFAIVPSVSARIFQAWNCEGFSYSPTEEHYFMRKDLSIRCYTSESKKHGRIRNYAFLLVGLWPLGVLVLYATLLFSARKNIIHHVPNRLVRAIAFLVRDYHPEYFYWELFELARRTTLSGWVLLVDERNSFTRVIVAVLVSLFMLVLTLVKKPYLNWEDQVLATSSHLMLLITFVGISYIKAYDDVKTFAEPTVPGIAVKIFGLESSNPIVLLLFFFALGMIILLCATLVYVSAQDGRIRTIRVRNTGRPPELTLREGQRFHLFSSRAPHT
jgi:hypothetical protein